MERQKTTAVLQLQQLHLLTSFEIAEQNKNQSDTFK